MKRLFAIVMLLVVVATGFAQDSVRPKRIFFSGYIKDLQSLQFNKNFTQSTYLNLVHNRLNLKWKPNQNWTAAGELRNRFFAGAGVTAVPDFAAGLRNTNEAVNASVIWLNRRKVVAHTNVERLWVEYRTEKWQMRSGRQRINWSMTHVWNPNDIFNTYNFLDFDYEERPGSDAVKLQYAVTDLSNIEGAIAFTPNRVIVAGKYATNFNGFDVHLLGGVYQGQATAGLGWAGSVKEAGFKGEAQYYFADTAAQLNVTTEVDYQFKNGLYLAGGLLFNRNGLKAPLSNGYELDFRVSPKNLMPSRWSFLLSTQKSITPLLSVGGTVVYAPELRLLVLFPTVRYNVFTDLDADLVWQSFFAEMNGSFGAISHTGFLRLRWSF